MASDIELRQNIQAAQRKAHYARGRREALQYALNLLSGIRDSPEGRRVYVQLSATLEGARREAADCAAELDAAYSAYNESFKRA